MEPIIKFIGYSIKSINYIRIDDEQELDKISEDLPDLPDGTSDHLTRKVAIGITPDGKQALLVLYAKSYDLENGRVIECELNGQFEIMQDLTEDDINAHISKSGVGILYPYLRATISTITALDSPKSILIPTINPNIYE